MNDLAYRLVLVFLRQFLRSHDTFPTRSSQWYSLWHSFCYFLKYSLHRPTRLFARLSSCSISRIYFIHQEWRVAEPHVRANKTHGFTSKFDFLHPTLHVLMRPMWSCDINTLWSKNVSGETIDWKMTYWPNSYIYLLLLLNNSTHLKTSRNLVFITSISRFELPTQARCSHSPL